LAHRHGSISRQSQLALVQGELDGIGGGLGAEVVHARLQAGLPAVEVHAGELGEVHVLHEDVEALALADVGPAVGAHVDDGLLADLPGGLVQLLQVLRDLRDVLHAAVALDDLVLHLLAPQAELHQVAQQVFVHHDELAAEHAPRVEVAGVGFEALVVAEDLRGAGRGHRRHQQAVADAVLLDLVAQDVPFPTVAGLHPG